MPDTVATLASLLPPSVVTAEYLRLLAPRDASIINHPALVYGGDSRLLGHTTVQMSELGLDGYKRLTARAPGAAGVVSALDDGDITWSVGPYFKAYEFDDLSRAVLERKISPEILARDAVMATANTLVELVAGLVGGGANASGTPGSALTAAQLIQARDKMAARNVPGPYLAFLSGIQLLHFHQSLATGTAGAIQWMPATAQQIEMYGEGFQGVWGGIWIYMSTLIPTANAGVDHAGGMVGRGGIVWGNASFAPEPDGNIVDFGASNESGRNPLRFERIRTGMSGKTAYATHANLGITEGMDDCIESIITKATV